MNILLIYPPVPEKSNDNIRPPLGLAYIAAILEKDHNVKIVDLNVEQLPNINNFDLIGISILTPIYISAKKLIASIRDKNKDIPIIVGGPHATALPELTLKENDITAVVRGEGELIIYDLVNAIRLKMPFKKVKGISYKEGDKIIHTQERELIKDLDTLPFPARHLLKMDRYKNYLGNNRLTTLITSRGCPYQCVYCFKLEGPNWRPRSAENIIEEIKQIIRKYNIKAFYFNDDLFTMNKERVLKFCDLAKNLGITWRCMARVNDIDEQLLIAMKKAGCVGINYGIESGDQTILKKIKKALTLEQAEEVIKLTVKVGIPSRLYFMLGFPWDTRETIRNTINFAKKLESDEIFFFIVTPFPKTELWNYAIENNIIDENNLNWSELYRNIEEIKDKIYFTNNLSEEEIINFKKQAYREVIKSKLFKKLIRLDVIYLYKFAKEKGIGRIFKFSKNVFAS